VEITSSELFRIEVASARRLTPTRTEAAELVILARVPISAAARSPRRLQRNLEGCHTLAAVQRCPPERPARRSFFRLAVSRHSRKWTRQQNVDRLLPLDRAWLLLLQRPMVQAVKISGNLRHYLSWEFTGHVIASSADFVGPILPVLGSVL